MSTIGSVSVGAMNIAGSVSGAQKPEADSSQTKAEAAAQKFQLDRQSMSASNLDDVSQTELSSERDADGRQAWDFSGEPNDADAQRQDAGQSAQNSRRSVDATGELGQRLDLDA